MDAQADEPWPIVAERRPRRPEANAIRYPQLLGQVLQTSPIRSLAGQEQFEVPFFGGQQAEGSQQVVKRLSRLQRSDGRRCGASASVPPAKPCQSPARCCRPLCSAATSRRPAATPATPGPNCLSRSRPFPAHAMAKRQPDRVARIGIDGEVHANVDDSPQWADTPKGLGIERRECKDHDTKMAGFSCFTKRHRRQYRQGLTGERGIS